MHKGLDLLFTQRTQGQILLDCFLRYFTFGEGVKLQSNNEVSSGSLWASGLKEMDLVDISIYSVSS